MQRSEIRGGVRVIPDFAPLPPGYLLLAGLIRRRARGLLARMRQAVVTPVSLGRRIVGAELGAEHGHGPLARLAGCRGRLHRFRALCGFATERAFWSLGGRLLYQRGILVRNR
jgi:hypothetical protein